MRQVVLASQLPVPAIYPRPFIVLGTVYMTFLSYDQTKTLRCVALLVASRAVRLVALVRPTESVQATQRRFLIPEFLHASLKLSVRGRREECGAFKNNRKLYLLLLVTTTPFK